MGSEIGEVLRKLCCELGWSYGVLWRGDGGDSGFLTAIGTYCEKPFEKVLGHVLKQVHSIGEGVVGSAASIGNHRWLFSDNFSQELLVTSAENLGSHEDDATLNRQFTSIKTLAIIPVQLLGVLEFGCSQAISENIEFIKKVKNMFLARQSPSEQLKESFPEQIGENHYSHGPCTSTTPIRHYSRSGNGSTNFIPNISFSRTTTDEQFPTASLPSFYPLASQHEVPESDVLSASFHGVYQLGDRPPLAKHHQTSSTGERLLGQNDTSLDQDILQSTSSHFDSLSNNHRSGVLNNEILTMMEQQLLKVIGAQDLPTSSQATTPLHGNAIEQFLQDSGMTLSNRNLQVYDNSLQQLPLSYFTDGYYSSNKLWSQGQSFHGEPWVNSVSELTLSEDFANRHTTSRLSSFSGAHHVNLSDHELRKEIGTTGGCGGSVDLASVPVAEFSTRPADVEILRSCSRDSSDVGSFLDHGIFNGIELDPRNYGPGQSYWEDIFMPEQRVSGSNLSTVAVGPGLDGGALGAASSEDIFSDLGLEQLTEAADFGNVNCTSIHASASNCNSVITHTSNNHYSNIVNVGSIPTYGTQAATLGVPCFSRTRLLPSGFNLDNNPKTPSSESHLKSQVSSWMDDCYSINAAKASASNAKRSDENVKVVKKRARPGESTRPRPKDRQLIQDRVKELREIVPNGAKCSIDSLLDRTIKHMIYLQNVTKYAEKVKQADESKMIGEENGVVLRDNASGDGGGATWAFEVAGQTMVCPIIVEDLSPPGQMLVEMLCEERGFFLEIADIIRGFGLTILRGLMEVRETKIWAHFLVEANRDVTRMQIFLSLVHLLQQTTGNLSSTSQLNRNEFNCDPPKFDSHKKLPSTHIPVSLPERLQ